MEKKPNIIARAIGANETLQPIIKNLTKAGLSLIGRLADKLEQKRRLDICNDCQDKTENNTCKFCGCPVSNLVQSINQQCENPEVNKWKMIP